LLGKSTLYTQKVEEPFLATYWYDSAYSEEVFRVGGSLHYLDSKNRELTTFRGVLLRHTPQIYKGHKLTNEIDKVLVSPNTGEFVYNGEYEKMKELGNPNVALGKFASTQMEKSFAHGKKVAAINPTQADHAERLLKISAKCTFCGKMTEDWWSYDGKTGSCKCNSCLKKNQVTPK
jgi:hypothetical protein